MRIILICLLVSISLLGSGQSGDQAEQAGSLEAALVFDQENFGDHFSVMAISEGDNNYYVTDLTRLASRFERIYFLNLSYGDDHLVNIEPDIEKSQMWFKAHYQFPEKDITCLLDDMKNEAVRISQSWSENEKQSWLIKFDKYNTRNNND